MSSTLLYLINSNTLLMPQSIDFLVLSNIISTKYMILWYSKQKVPRICRGSQVSWNWVILVLSEVRKTKNWNDFEWQKWCKWNKNKTWKIQFKIWTWKNQYQGITIDTKKEYHQTTSGKFYTKKEDSKDTMWVSKLCNSTKIKTQLNFSGNEKRWHIVMYISAHKT